MTKDKGYRLRVRCCDPDGHPADLEPVFSTTCPGTVSATPYTPVPANCKSFDLSYLPLFLPFFLSSSLALFFSHFSLREVNDNNKDTVHQPSRPLHAMWLASALVRTELIPTLSFFLK